LVVKIGDALQLSIVGIEERPDLRKGAHVVVHILQLSKVMRQETAVIQNMAQLPEPERMQFWHEHDVPLEAQDKGLRARLLIVGQRMSPLSGSLSRGSDMVSRNTPGTTK